MAATIELEYQEIAQRNGWPKEFEKIRETCSKYDYTFVEAKRPENAIYNRYMDICPYDHSRVIIKKGVHSYINANLVKIDKANKQYILTQGPTVASTPDFWRMVWECDSRAIIMLNKRIENDKIKCSLYWPDHIGTEYCMKLPQCGLTVELLTENSHTYYSTRVIRVTDTETNTSREVIQFHYTTWPDFGVPSSPMAFLEFLYKVRASGAMDSSVGPPIVHCSAGVGRSGTFCLVDSCLVMIDKYGAESVNVREVLLEMRKYRMGLIQTPDQLRFSYQAIIKGAKQIDDSECEKSDAMDDVIENDNKDDSSDPPPIPPRRAASLKTNCNSTENIPSDTLTTENSTVNTNEHITNGIDTNSIECPPTKDLPDIPSDSEEDDIDEVSSLEGEPDDSEDKHLLVDSVSDEETAKKTNISEKDADGVRRRQAAAQKTANLQERVQEMKRKQQKAEQWQQKKRRLSVSKEVNQSSNKK
ncbi:protein tyrosine phosphatase 61F isoform X2 [Arctopsyche grandis]|uniref:protein tyrosine phosphatase 61F isoform X2 n=1 Tax=Arctopsyche grandis TaxID=121162 RepID=UPI00406DA0F1